MKKKMNLKITQQSSDGFTKTSATEYIIEYDNDYPCTLTILATLLLVLAVAALFLIKENINISSFGKIVFFFSKSNPTCCKVVLGLIFASIFFASISVIFFAIRSKNAYLFAKLQMLDKFANDSGIEKDKSELLCNTLTEL